ncbi:MAG TPA: hypothetical protein V6C58_14000 [Allocoleopsis sp.]
MKNKIALAVKILPELLSISVDNKGTKIFYVSSLREELQEEISRNILNISLQQLLDTNSKFFLEFYKKYQTNYTDLTKDMFHMLLNIVIDDLFNKSSSVEKRLSSIYFEWEKKILNIIEKTTLIPDDVSKYNEGYSILSSISSLKLTEQKVNLDHIKIIQEFQLSKKIPIAHIYDYSTKNPIFKIYTDFSKIRTKKYIQSKFQEEKFNIGNVKNLVLKVNTDIDNFSTISFSKIEPKITIKLNFDKEKSINYHDILDHNKISRIIIDQLKQIYPEIKFTSREPLINFINIYFIIKKHISFSQLKVHLKYFKDVLEYIPPKSFDNKNVFKIRYIPDDLSVLIKTTEQIKDFRYLQKINSILVSGIIREEYQIRDVMNAIINLFYMADKNSNVKNTKVEIAKVKKLKVQGVKIDSVSCQKERQPTILDIEDKVHLGDSYVLNTGGNKFVCLGNIYKYPGFTSKNTVCCFKKDQRNKPIFLKNINSEIPTDKTFSDADIIKNGIVKKEIILDPNNLGVLPKNLRELGNYHRLGNIQNKHSFLNCINLSKKTVKIQDLISNKRILRHVLNNFDFSEEEFVDYLRKDMLTHDYLIDLVSYYTKTNVIIIESNKFTCDFSLYSDYIFIVKNDKFYELLVQKISSEKLKKVFTSEDLIVKKYLDLLKKCRYQKSGITQYFPMSIRELLHIDTLKIHFQILNKFNKASYILTNHGLLPVYATDIILEIKTRKYNPKFLLDPEKQRNLLVSLKEKLKYLTPKSYVLNEYDEISGILTISGLIVPVKVSKIDKRKWSLGIDKNVKFYKILDDLLKDPCCSLDDRSRYMTIVMYYSEITQRIRFLLSKILIKQKIPDNLQSIKNMINGILKNKVKIVDKLHIRFPIEIPQRRKLCKDTKIKDIFCVNGLLVIERRIYTNIIQNISNEIFFNKNSEIIKGTVSEIVRIGSSGFIKRKNERIFENEKELRIFLK